MLLKWPPSCLWTWQCRVRMFSANSALVASNVGLFWGKAQLSVDLTVCSAVGGCGLICGRWCSTVCGCTTALKSTFSYTEECVQLRVAHRDVWCLGWTDPRWLDRSRDRGLPPPPPRANACSVASTWGRIELIYGLRQ